MGYSFRLAARVLLYASSHRQDNKYHGLCYTSCGALAGTREREREREIYIYIVMSVCVCVFLLLSKIMFIKPLHKINMFTLLASLKVCGPYESSYKFISVTCFKELQRIFVCCS